MCCSQDIPNSCEKWGTNSFFKGPHLDVYLRSWTWWWPRFYLMLWFDNDMAIWPTTLFIYVFLRFLLLLKPFVMAFLAPLPPPPKLLFFVQPMLLGLHHIFRLATRTRCHLNHFHFLTTSYVWPLLMNIGYVLLVPNKYFTWHNKQVM